MMKLGSVSLKGAPKVAVVITDQAAKETIPSLHADALELRVDMFSDRGTASVVNHIREWKDAGPALILTVRNAASEGGAAGISDGEKLAVFRAAAPFVDAVDIELKSPVVSEVIALARKNGKAVIVSSHDFTGTPADAVLEGIFLESVQKGADIVKIAAQADSMEDVSRLMLFTLQHRDDNVITMSLGEIGAISRLAFPAAGSLLTYSYAGRPSAPGQIPLERLQRDLRRYYPAYNRHLIDTFGVPEDV